jgi:hypothetical protein
MFLSVLTPRLYLLMPGRFLNTGSKLIPKTFLHVEESVGFWNKHRLDVLLSYSPSLRPALLRR